ncbi:MAG: type IV pilus modification PilV family protein [Luteolibacter sp.]
METIRLPNTPSLRRARGFTLPAILVVVGALLILAVGALLIVGIERNTSRAFSDRERANLAARAGLEDVKGIFAKEAANDDFLVLHGPEIKDPKAAKDPAPYLYLARGSGGGENVSYRYVPLFSAEKTPPEPTAGDPLKAPLAETLLDSKPKANTDISTLPWYDPAKVSWVNILNSNGKMISRYAYWVEDLQSRVDAGTAGNTKDTAGAHRRYGWKTGDMQSTEKSARFPAPGLNPEESKPGPDGRDAAPPLDQVALYAIDPESKAKDESILDKTIIDGRKALISPESVLAVSGIAPPLTRGADGRLADLKARSLEENLTASVRPYDEQPLVPFAYGIDPSVTGEPKLNLNSLLAKPPAAAVDEMAAWISEAIPDFENRKGAFPDNYLKTLAANALDYADQDDRATSSSAMAVTGPDAYRGLDVYPLISEVILHFKYQGVKTVKGRKVMNWQIQVFVEIWNHTNFPVLGSFRVSYENKLKIPAIGPEPKRNFDNEEFLVDPTQVKLTNEVVPTALPRIGDEFWSPPLTVNLRPNQYEFFTPIDLTYTLDLGPSSTTIDSQFNIDEDGWGDSGISLMWEGRVVDRSHKLVRKNLDPNFSKTDFITNFQKQDGFANVPAHSYGIPGSPAGFKNNMGDCRQSLYLRTVDFPLSDNSYPGNVSPNQRNVRNSSVYKGGSGQSLVYGRVLPSEWPDGGHDVPVQLSVLTPANVRPSASNYNPTALSDFTNANEGDTPTFISNAERFYSATELGRLFDPIMWVPTYNNGDSILAGTMPSGRNSWPSVEPGNNARNPENIYYGGGNTLRIGRPEHPKFDTLSSAPPAEMPGSHAARLLDIFHAGKSRSTDPAEIEGNLVRIEGHVNLNTATEDALRALAAGNLQADPRLARTNSQTHSAATAAPPVTLIEVPSLTQSKQADLLAQAIVRGRPYSSPSEIATSRDQDGKVAFGNPLLYPEFKITSRPNMSSLQWSDAAAEEAFARVYNSSTVRSRNFRVWVVGQAVAPTAPSNLSPDVLSEVRRVLTVFADPGERNSDGSIDSSKFKTSIIHENDF